jgi:hypothetical protein
MNKERNYFRIKWAMFKHATDNGNPVWRVELEDAQGNTYSATTAPNSSAGWWFSNSSANREALFSYHYTKGGRMRIDNIEPSYLALAWITGGWRERYAMRHGRMVRVGDDLIAFKLRKEDPIQDANGATYNTSTCKWVN